MTYFRKTIINFRIVVQITQIGLLTILLRIIDNLISLSFISFWQYAKCDFLINFHQILQSSFAFRFTFDFVHSSILLIHLSFSHFFLFFILYLFFVL